MLSALQAPTFVSRLFGREAAAPRRVTRWFASQVRQGATHAIEPASGRMTLHCRGGEAWITHDGDPKDVFLRANQSHSVDNGSRMTVYAMRGDCVFEIEVAE